ncbi:vesicle transport v-SNARE protein VTI1, putative [Plasmodium relictum]|uniref:Vesicle transport v-SNARE protein VTI1, putative n=1 Tax=Plasmodium relictum TaxID=85471 RepID=A0A1J1HBJ9_PLARL|nr:vesicle transport v-SNARE protein VTI1, putative [Plasmodium relictum]CRH02787.1 vesicle transport v-SNARE protein VTI1, putative [Plasmodium relictum]
MSDALYNDYKNNYYEYMKTVLYTEKIINDNNSDQNKLLNIYEKAIKSAENMYKRMQLEVETNSMIENAHNELNNMHNEISECKKKLRKLKEEIMKKDQRNNEFNNCDDRILLLSDVDLLEKGDVYINQSKILLDNTEYISNDVMKNLNKQRECIKKNISNISFVSDKLNEAKNIMKNLKNKELLNKYRLYIIFFFIFLTFFLITCVKYNRYTKNDSNSNIQQNSNTLIDFVNNQEINNLDNENTNNLMNKLNNVNKNNSIIYDFVEKNKNNEKSINSKSTHEFSFKTSNEEDHFNDNKNRNDDGDELNNVNENEDGNGNQNKDENGNINDDKSYNENNNKISNLDGNKNGIKIEYI